MSIVLTDLTKWFDNNLVVNKVSLEVTDGELFVLLGGSGSGKSTILRLIAGLSIPSSGRIELNGRDVTFLPVQSRGVGFVFQNYSVFRHMTVGENIEFGLRIRKAHLKERRQRTEELLDLVGLAGLGARYAHQLSGGQQQRVALARALAYYPDVLLLDEPFGALDVKIRAQLRTSLKEIQRQLHVTTILVTHDQEEAFELADRIGVIERGHLIEVGAPQELYHHPCSEYVATFVGGGNVLIGREEQGFIRLGDARLPFPPGAPVHDPGSPVRILFRPETVSIQTEPFSEAQKIHILSQGQIVKRIFTGSSQRVLLEVENLEGMRPLASRPEYGQRVTHIEALQPSDASNALDRAWEPGSKLWIGLKQFHVLEPVSLKVLISSESAFTQESAAQFGCQVARTAGGNATVVSVVNSAAEAARRREDLETLRQSWISDLPHLETRVRQGDFNTEIVHEVQEGHYELVVLESHKGGLMPSSLGQQSTVRRLLAASEAAVLLVRKPHPRLERLLICTATGEPGKSDVLFGARIARRANIPTTVFHVLSPQASPVDRRRVERHLSQAQISLNGMGVENTIKIAEGPVMETIVGEIERGGYDLVVIGAPNLFISRPISRPDLAAQIINHAERPVLIVPMIQ